MMIVSWISDAVSGLIGPVTDLISEVVEDKDKANDLAHKISTMAATQAHAKALAQMAVNRQEAAHKSLFVAGWRPGAGWVCVLALAMNYLVIPLFGAPIEAYTAMQLEPLDLEIMLPVLLGMLGLGGARTLEKTRGVSRER